ncbi:LexA family protein [Xanthomonas euvesicatoria]|uniref:DNA polymerase V n=1 Tax=Xanthomonas euvesicatoria TaxID=456327 RepID=A0AAW3U1R7_XANEU|nr:S24 family peptidase [Xanthomonas euvesicatoria]MBB4722680.1 DNA polymerase V [Xanthomonas euvesicatoria]MBB4869273.1 DNA polymerase V [Xanthomonas euvesicatoria]
MLSLPPPHTYARLLGLACLDPSPLGLPLSALCIQLGFPSPAEDFQDDEIDLNQVLIRNPPATFLYRAERWSMLLAGVCDGDILVVDGSARPISGDMVLAIWDGNQPVCKILQVASDHIELHSRSPHCAPIILAPGTEVEVFAVVGVVRQVIRTHARAGR